MLEVLLVTWIVSFKSISKELISVVPSCSKGGNGKGLKTCRPKKKKARNFITWSWQWPRTNCFSPGKGRVFVASGPWLIHFFYFLTLVCGRVSRAFLGGPVEQSGKLSGREDLPVLSRGGLMWCAAVLAVTALRWKEHGRFQFLFSGTGHWIHTLFSLCYGEFRAGTWFWEKAS